MAATYSDLEGKVVLVTGGSSGIGEAIVRRFAAQKSKVAFIDIQETESRALKDELVSAGGTVHFEKTDLTDIAALRASVERIRGLCGPIRILINNAAHDERHATETVTPEYWDDRIAVNLKHQFFAAQAVLPDMKAANEGAIVNFGSVSWMVGQGGMAAYTAAKSGVIGLTRSLARDFGPYNIRVNAIAPGWIMTKRQIEKWLTPEGERELMQRQCLKRKLVPDDVARFTVFLASQEAGACTNQHYVVDGGWV
jgi:NAD(P)-dependent dehydrogenase (short-subunit alcohol dehydrogenase family)